MADRTYVWGEGIKTLRDIYDMTQEQLSAASGVSQAAISRLENGSRKASDATRVRLARALHVDPHKLFPYDVHLESEVAS